MMPLRFAGGFGLGLMFLVLGCGGVDDSMKCSADTDCFAGYACDSVLTEQCLRRCESDTQCLASQACDIAAGATSGVCRMLPD